MEIKDIANKLSCGSGDTPDTGKLGCLSLFGTPDNLLGLRKGFKIPADTTFDLAYLTPLIQKGDIVPLIGASSFEDTSAEDAYSTNASGVKRLNLKGLPEYKFMYEEGHEFYRQLDRLTNYKNMDFIIGDTEGNWMLTTNSDGSYGGFTAGHVTAELTKRKVEGGDAESRSLLIQFLDRLQFDRNYAILHQDQIGFIPSDVPAVNGAHLEFTAVPADTDGTVTVSTHLNSDHSTVVTGLESADFNVSINGTTDAGATVAETPADSGIYVITLTSALATNDSVEVHFWDGF